MKTHRFLLIAVLFAAPVFGQNAARLVSIEGKVEVARAGAAQWNAGKTNQSLALGDRVRTGLRSRAAVLHSDKSVQRLDELTTIEIRQPQSPGGGANFEQKSGASYFFNRERPGTVEFRTPLASGAIRGTEFALLVGENGSTEVALLDGLVNLQNEFGEVSLANDELGIVEPGQAPRKTAVLDARSIIQWALYYPGVVDVDELALTNAERDALRDSVSAYRAGDLLAAQSGYPENRVPQSDAEKLYRAATLLAVGRVAESTQLVQNVSSPIADALRQLVATVKGATWARQSTPTLATEWMAESYSLQAQSRIREALAAARKAADKSPDFGFAWARVAELEFSSGRTREASRVVEKTLALSPRNAQAHALRGFLFAAQNKFDSAREAFAKAIEIDPALGNAWLGSGLVKIRQGHGDEGRADLQVAATLEPQRSVLRSYLGKAWSHTRETATAEKELALAQKFDPNDPTPWLYSAILLEQQNRVNEAVRALEHSQELNENRSVFRSEMLLDQDKAVRSANLARIYQDAGMTGWSVREASRAVSYDYANFSAHQFLANSYDALRDPRQINLRYEAPAVSEYFIATLLAPVGATPLSQNVSQQEYTRLFDRDHVGIASSSEYFSSGDFVQRGSQYGVLGGTEWSLDGYYRNENGQRPNNELEQTVFAARAKQQLTSSDTIYFEAQRSEFVSGDVIQYYDQASANQTTRIKEVQEPNLFLGYHHEWSPGNHTLALAGRLEDDFYARVHRGTAIELNHNPDGDLTSVRLRPFGIRLNNDIEAYTAELQQILSFNRHTIVFGGRAQQADSDAQDRTALTPGAFPGPGIYPTRRHFSEGEIERYSAYVYDMWQVMDALHLTAGLAYDHLSFPRNQEVAPINSDEGDRSQLSPKAGVIYTPTKNTTVRGAYTRSLGGVFFDNSFRLEPTQVAGFNQALRSAIPESIVGNVAGTRFETFGLGFERRFSSGTYVSIGGEIIDSSAARSVGAFDRFENSTNTTPASAAADLEFQERSIAVEISQLVGDHFAFGGRYRLTDADFNLRFVSIAPRFASALFNPRVENEATLHQAQLYGIFNHRSGFFAQADAIFASQDNRGYTPALDGDEVVQFNAYVGYRFWRRHAEVKLGVLNIGDKDYKLNPLTLYSELPRERTFYASLKFYF